MLNSLNQYLGNYTGRKFPNSMSELKTNVSNNVQTCAKICSLFLNSSFGVGVGMGVVGLVTTSLCAGEDVLPIITSTILPFTTDVTTNASSANDTTSTEMAFLCFKDLMQNKSISGHIAFSTLLIDSICKLSVMGVDCDEMLNNTMANFSILTPQSVDVGYSILSDYKQLHGNEYSFLDLYRADEQKVTMFVKATDCLREKVFYVVNLTAGPVIKLSDMKRGFCQSSNQSIDDLCIPDFHHGTYFVLDKEHINNPLSTFASVTESVLPDSCDGCSTMQLVFGVGSAMVLVATVAKVIYQQRKVARFNNSRASSSRVRQATTVLCNDGLLLGAAGLGSGVLVSALRDPCGPVDGSTNKLVLTSTVMYGMSAASSLLQAITCREVDREDQEDEEPIIELDAMSDEDVELGAMDSMV